jgi:outer membrane protein assembly factor BamC
MRLLLLILCVMLAGCGWLRDDKGIFVNRSDDYIDVKERKELVIPEDLDASRVNDPHPIPPANTVLNSEFYPERPPRPDAIFANDNRDEVRLQRLGDRRWLVIPEPATTVWPKVRQFLAENGVSVAAEDPQHGRIDTEWMEVSRGGSYRDVIRLVIADGKADSGLSGGEDRLLIRVEQGLKERNSEIQLRYQNDRLATPQRGILVENLNSVESSIPEVETELLNELGAYIASKVAEQAVSRVAQTISGGVKSRIIRDSSGEPVLELDLDYDRAWATIAQALTRAEVEITEFDEQAGVYRVIIPESLFSGKGSGFLGGIFGGRQKYDLELRFKKTGANQFYVMVFDDDAQPVDRDLSQEVLTMIREFAS